jgi:hypothetical protein
MRMRFNKVEKAQFTTGAVIEWRNGRHWHPGVVHDGTVQCDHGTFQHILIRNTSRKGGVPHGEIMYGEPTQIRMPQND